MTAKQATSGLTNAVRKILLREWDPCGVGGGGPDDEYDDYVLPVAQLVMDGKSASEIADYLLSIEVRNWLSPFDDRERNRAAHLLSQLQVHRRLE